MKNKLANLVFEIVIGAVGIAFMFAGDWKVATGVILLMWSNNMKHTRELYENS